MLLEFNNKTLPEIGAILLISKVIFLSFVLLTPLFFWGGAASGTALHSMFRFKKQLFFFFYIAVFLPESLWE